MRSRVYCVPAWSVLSACVAGWVCAASAASGTWNSTAPGANGYWTNSLNWSASPAPAAADTALFNNAGNGQTAIDLAGLLSIKYITYDSPAVAAYTNGAGAANSQTLVLEHGGEIKLSASAGSSPVFNCALQLGADRTAQSYTIRNDSPSQTLTFNDIFGCPPEASGNAGAKALTVCGFGPVSLLGNLRPNGASALTLFHSSSNTLTLAGSNMVTTLTINGGPNAVLDIGDKELFLNNGGGNVLNCSQNATITGTGKIRISTTDGFTSTGYNYIDCSVDTGRTLVINPEITGVGGIETWGGSGTFVLNGLNTFESHIIFGTPATIVCSKVGNRGSVDSNLGKGTNIYFSGGGKLVYTGTGEDSNRQILLNNNAVIDQSGPGGKLNFSVTPTIVSGTRTLTLQGSTAGVGEFSAPLSNSGGTLSLTKAGAGTWMLSRTNTFTGATTLNGGALLVNSPGSLARSSAVTVNAGVLGGNGIVGGTVSVAASGALAPGGINAAGTLSLTNNSSTSLTLNGGTLHFDVSNVATDKVDITGASSRLVLNGTNTVVITLPAGSAAAGTYTLMTFGGYTGTGKFVLGSALPDAALALNATSLQLVVAGSGTSALKWTGDVSSSWDGADLNWTNGAAAVAYPAGEAARFDDSAARFTVGSAAAVSPSSVLFNNSVSNYEVSAAVAGTGSVFKIGSAEASLTGANTFTGPTFVSGGSLVVGGSGVMGGGNYATNIYNNGTLTFASSAAQTNSGVISGGGLLVQSGSGLLALGGNNSYQGMTIVTSGVLRAQHANALGSTAGGTVVSPGAQLELAGNVFLPGEALELRGTLSSAAGSNTFSGAVWVQEGAFFHAEAGAVLVVSGNTQINGTNNFSKVGAGTLAFTGDPNHKGVCTVAEGLLILQHGGSTDGSWVINPGATLRDTFANDLGDRWYIQANGTLDMRVSDTVGPLLGSGLVTNSGASAVTLTVGGGDFLPAEFSGVIRNGEGSATVALSKTGSAPQTLSGANTHSGGTTLGGGQLNINNASALGTGTFTISGAYAVDNSSGADITLAANNAQAWNGDFTFIGSKSLNMGSGTVTLGGSRTVTVLTNTLAVGGAIGGSYSLTKNGGGALALSGVSTYSGATTVNGGTLLVNSPGALARGSAVTVASGVLGGNGTIGGTVNLLAGSLLAPGGVNAIGTLSLTNNSAASLTLNGNTLYVDLGTAAGTCDKIDITGASGKLVLNGTNTVALTIPEGGAPAGTYTLMTCAGGITTNAGAVLMLQSAYPNATLSVIGNDVVLTTTAGISGLTWTGATSGLWDGADPVLNWTNGSAAVAFAAGDAVTFNDAAEGNFTVGSGAAVAPSSLLFNNSLNDYSVSAAISGTAPLMKQGSGAASLSNAGAYNPASITVHNGTLTLGGASQLNGGSYAGPVVNNGTLNYASSAAQTSSGMISGGGALLLSGNGMLTLSGTNSYSGVTAVNAGTLKLASPSGLGLTTVGTAVAPGATLELAGDVNTLAEALSLGGRLSSQTGSNTFNGTVTLTTGSSIDVAAGSTLVLKAFTANGPFVKTGAGWLRLTTDPNGNGLMTVREGVAEITGGTMDANIVVNSGASLIGNNTTALNDSSTRVQVDAGGTYVLRQSDTLGGFAGAGTVTKDTAGTAVLTLGNNNVAETFSGVIQNGSGVLALTKNGTGVQTLSGANTYTGATAVNGGTLLVNSPGSLAAGSAVTVSRTTTLGGSGSVNGAVTVAGGGNLAPGGLNTIGTLTLGSTLALNGGMLFADLPATGTTCDQVACSGALTLNGLTVVSLSFPDGAAQAGSYTLMTFPSYSGSGSFVLLGSYPNASLALNATSLVLTVTGGGISGLVWKGSGSSFWDGGDLNWRLGGAASGFASGDAVTLDDTATNFNVVSSGPVTPSSVLINNSLNTYAVGANITGTGPLAKYGTATVILNNLGTYNPGLIYINAGTLSIANSARLNSGTYSGAITNYGTYNHSSSAAQTLSGVIAGSGSLTKTGSGSLTLNAPNMYSGGTTFTTGTSYGIGWPTVFGFGTLTFNSGGSALELQNNADMAFTNAVNVSSVNPTIRVGRTSSGAGVTHSLGALTINSCALTVTNTANVTVNTPFGLTFGAVALNGNATNNIGNNGTGRGTLTLGAITGNNGLTKTGNGILFLTGSSSRSSGTTALLVGTLKIGAPSGLGTAGAALQLNSGILDLASDVGVNAHPTVVGGSMTIQSDKATASSPGISHTLGTLAIGTYTLTVTNGSNVAANSTFGVTFGTTVLSGVPVFDVGNNGAGLGTLTLGAVTNNNANGLTKRGNGTLKLVGVNVYRGNTTNTNGRILGVTGGSCSNSPILLLSGGHAGAVAKLGVLCTSVNGQWACASLTNNVVAPASTNPALEFAFSVMPSTTVAPLLVTGNVFFAVTPSVTVYLNNLGPVPEGTYPLMTVGGTAPTALPPLTMVGGYSGSSLAWSGDGKTLNLTVVGGPEPLRWSGVSGVGTWDVNNSANAVWRDSAAAAAYYQEMAGPGLTGDRVLFDDTYLGSDAVVTLNTLVAPTSVMFSNVTYKYTFSGSGGITGAISLVKAGSNVVTLATANSYTGMTRVSEGTLVVGSGGRISHPQAHLEVGSGLFTNALFTIESGAAVTSRWLLAGTTNGAVGAVYNRGSLALAGATSISNFALGFATGGYGYFRHDSAVPLTIGETGIGGSSGGNGVFDVAQGAVTNSTYFQMNRGAGQQHSQVNVKNGRLVMPNSNANAHMFYSTTASGQGVISVSEGGLLGSAGTATELDLLKASTSTSANGILNLLSGGTVQATRIKATQTAGTALVNFNGGTLKANDIASYMLKGNIDRATVYANGVTVDTDGKGVSIAQPLLAPAGSGVTLIPVTGNGTGYIGRPVIVIAGGGGVGATAVADYNPLSQEVTGITVTSPGNNYSSTPTVTVTGGGGIPPTLGTTTIDPVASGGLTKCGNGTLTLAGANTYGGATTISNGTLRLGASAALPTNSPLVLAGGVLDLNGFTVTNGSIALISGSIINGSLNGTNVTKTGSSNVTLSVQQTLPAPISIEGGTLQLSGLQSASLVAGLYEGRLDNNAADLTTPNPRTAVKLSTTNAYRYFDPSSASGGIWVDNSTYVYTGYLWNRSATNENWTFCKAFDDTGWIKVESTVVINNGAYNSYPTANFVLTPGPHPFEVRLGQGGGGVGQQAAANCPGVGFDPLGRGDRTLCRRFDDPGDGSLLTYSLSFQSMSGTNQLAAGSTVQMASNTVLNLGGSVQTLAGLSGSGLVTNGTLTVNGTIAPGGLNALGTLTLATSSATLGGTLRVDVADEGASDVLAAQGDVTLSGLALVVDNPELMAPSETYTILTCTGTRTGTFSSKSVPSGWVVLYEPNGDIKLRYLGGTQIILH